jgi:site-specific DNA-methyltransferase (adenine-specific)
VKPYYAEDGITLYHGDCREVLPSLEMLADLIVADPPYGETSLEWDRWPDGWPEALAACGRSLWCFGSLRMFLERRDEFGSWKLSQDVVWDKPSAHSPTTDRFTRRHELAAHFYRGSWKETYHEQQRVDRTGPEKGSVHRGETGPAWNGSRRAHTWTDDGSRAVGSILQVGHMRLRGIHPTEKPLGILDPLIRYGCPPNGLVLDPFAGSASTLVAAAASGRQAVGIEADEHYCEMAAKRLCQGIMDFGSAS